MNLKNITSSFFMKSFLELLDFFVFSKILLTYSELFFESLPFLFFFFHDILLQMWMPDHVIVRKSVDFVIRIVLHLNSKPVIFLNRNRHFLNSCRESFVQILIDLHLDFGLVVNCIHFSLELVIQS